jgi:hypothetical protein
LPYLPTGANNYPGKGYGLFQILIVLSSGSDGGIRYDFCMAGLFFTESPYSAKKDPKFVCWFKK